METITIRVNPQTAAGKAIMSMLDFFRKEGSGVEFVDDLTTKDKDFLKRLNRSAKEAKEITKGKRKGKSLSTLLDEL